jgi:spore coat protein U-like protein
VTARGIALAAWLALLAAFRVEALPSCTVSATGPVFGIYNPLSGAALDSNGSVIVTCTRLGAGGNRFNGTVTLSPGASGTFAARTMRAGAPTLNYNLYLDAAYTQVWGDGTASTFDWTFAMRLTRRNPTQQVTGIVYGQIAARQDVAPGSYVDTIVVTVTY